jgi:hypothetical protein
MLNPMFSKTLLKKKWSPQHHMTQQSGRRLLQETTKNLTARENNTRPNAMKLVREHGLISIIFIVFRQGKNNL